MLHAAGLFQSKAQNCGTSFTDAFHSAALKPAAHTLTCQQPAKIKACWFHKKMNTVFVKPKVHVFYAYVSVCVQSNALPIKVHSIWYRARTLAVNTCTLESFLLVQCLLFFSPEIDQIQLKCLCIVSNWSCGSLTQAIVSVSVCCCCSFLCFVVFLFL